MALCLSSAGGAAIAVSVVSPPRAFADDPPKRAPQTFLYHPKAYGNEPELADTRTGAIYKRNDASSRWELVIKPVGQE
jgi:hypothetical protein